MSQERQETPHNSHCAQTHSPRPRFQLPFTPPDPPFEIALIEPEIPQNTGNIARLCAATGALLHLVEPLGFRLTSRDLKRAGLDYWDSVNLHRHSSLTAFRHAMTNRRLFLFSTSGRQSYTHVAWQPGDVLVFGSESRGLPLDWLATEPSNRICNIPMRLDHVRSLNLANAAAIALYEALRQTAEPSCNHAESPRGGTQGL